jgi:hypothetical protein
MGKKVKVPVQYAWVGQAGSLPPPPRSVGGAVCGGGGLAGPVQPGDFEQGRGDLWKASRELKWQIFLASKFGGFLAGESGRLPRQDILAGHFGAFI